MLVAVRWTSPRGELVMKGHMLTLASVLLAMASPSAAASRGASFLKEAMQGDNSETTLGSIAAKRGASAGVRDFGRMLSTDHRKGKAQAAAVARQMHVPVTDEMAPEAIAERAKLARLRGRSFDREFTRYMVDDHHKDIAKFSAEVSSRDPGPVVALAKQTLPVLRKHLATAERFAR
jgi:putative membrane protein